MTLDVAKLWTLDSLTATINCITAGHVFHMFFTLIVTKVAVEESMSSHRHYRISRCHINDMLILLFLCDFIDYSNYSNFKRFLERNILLLYKKKQSK